MARIDHAAIRTKLYEEAQRFFEDVFEMHMWREIGEKPGRKCWYKEGIQLCEVEELDSETEIMEKIKAYPVKAINDHWFSLPNGTKIELKPLAEWKVDA